MDKCSSTQKHPKIQNEASSLEWEFIKMTEQEEDIICRMHKLVGDKWELIAGRIPGRSAEEIERFWLMRNGDERKRKANNIERAPPLHVRVSSAD
ncbi:MYB-like transcription factor ETC3 [Salvia miltiorrhiza]|uniref:MYB-like transcription factor ETC3 n=1 Tax=Salvia miltiorrhiza TaxID=226208 RepID=UPI0001CADF0D|nr:MYB-like transcription factor ETC3 [Salvia miltiorrhiza]